MEVPTFLNLIMMAIFHEEVRMRPSRWFPCHKTTVSWKGVDVSLQLIECESLELAESAVPRNFVNTQVLLEHVEPCWRFLRNIAAPSALVAPPSLSSRVLLGLKPKNKPTNYHFIQVS